MDGDYCDDDDRSEPINGADLKTDAKLTEITFNRMVKVVLCRRKFG